MSKSIIVPDGMTEYQVLNMRVDEGKWIEMLEYQCVCCGRPAYRNPYTDAKWGCKLCGFTGSFDSCSASGAFRFNPNQFIPLARKQGMLGYGKNTINQIVRNPGDFTIGIGKVGINQDDEDKKFSSFIFRRQEDALNILVFSDTKFDSREEAMWVMIRLMESFLHTAVETLNDSTMDWNAALSTGIIVLIENMLKRHDVVRTNDLGLS